MIKLTGVALVGFIIAVVISTAIIRFAIMIGAEIYRDWFPARNANPFK